ncbi:hypothetical protein FMEAI12_3280020 [Parafrankia sp. Ea1.12]|nr:hypothetical protein FMEAI12_3280020 [Parafrankia sp. Ea1.12]
MDRKEVLSHLNGYSDLPVIPYVAGELHARENYSIARAGPPNHISSDLRNSCMPRRGSIYLAIVH